MLNQSIPMIIIMQHLKSSELHHALKMSLGWREGMCL